MRRTPIRRVSKKRQSDNVILRKRSRIFLEKHPECIIKSPRCTYHATCVHHMKGRIGYLLLAEEFWCPACWPCNGYCEDYKKWAVERGFRLDRLGNL